MAVKQILNDALHTPMTRKEFLGQIGALFLAIIGVSAIVHTLHSTQTGKSDSISSLLESYGASAYGGK